MGIKKKQGFKKKAKPKVKDGIVQKINKKKSKK